jgi:hypothetical protein
MYEKFPAVDSTSFSVNGTDAVCANYTQCPNGYFQSFPGMFNYDYRVACISGKTGSTTCHKLMITELTGVYPPIVGLNYT